MSVDLVVEEMLFKVEAQGRDAHEVADELLQLPIVAGSGLAKALRSLWPDVGYEIALAFWAGEVGLVGPALATEVVVLLKVRRRHVGVAVTQSLVADRLVASGHLDVDRHHLLLLFDRQGKKFVRLAVEVPDHIRRHTMARDSEKPNLGADAINLSPCAQARDRIAGERGGEIDDRDLHLCCFHSMLQRRRQTGRQWPGTSTLHAAQDDPAAPDTMPIKFVLYAAQGRTTRKDLGSATSMAVGYKRRGPCRVTPPPGRQTGHHPAMHVGIGFLSAWTRASPAIPSGSGKERDLPVFAKRAGLKVVAVVKET